MANLKVDTVSGIGTEGVVLDGGLKFRSLNYMTLPKGDTTQRGRGRGIFADGDQSKTIEFVTIQSLGNAVDFGDLSNINGYPYGLSSTTRGIIAGGLRVSSPDTASYNNIELSLIHI